MSVKAPLSPQTREKLREMVLEILPHEPEVGYVLGVLLDEAEQWEAVAALAIRYKRQVEEMEAERDNARTMQEVLLERIERLEARLSGELFGPEEPADYEVEEPVYHTREWSA